jgi:glycosyltransferase involved in cell wall biosynthesis
LLIPSQRSPRAERTIAMANRSPDSSKLRVLFVHTATRPPLGADTWIQALPRLLAAADILPMPSFQEPFGLVYAEAMAMKKPVVAFDNGGTPEVVEHDKSGLLSPQDDVPALAANLRRLVYDPELRTRMGEYGRQQVETRFVPRRLAEDVARVYTDVMGRS